MKFDIVDPEIQRSKKMKQKKKNDIRFITILGSLLLILVLLVIYYNSIDDNTSTPKAPRIIQQSRLKIVNENSNERPLAIMIDNNVGNELHAGLQDSYINYEIIVEGGLTRIMAIYKDKDVALVGPVRSARHYFLDYAMEHNAVYAHYGWSPVAEKDINDLDINNINGMTDSEPFYRDTSIKAPHNVFTSTDRLRNYFSNKGYEIEHPNWKVLKYSYNEIDMVPSDEESTNNNVKKANKVVIPYSNSQIRSYTYDEDNKYYLRFMNNNPHLDKTTKKQLHYKNIIIMKVNNKNLDNDGRQDLATTGTGEGYFITNGCLVPIIWSKDSRSSKTIFTYDNGDEVLVNDGNTFIQVVPFSSDIVVE